MTNVKGIHTLLWLQYRVVLQYTRSLWAPQSGAKERQTAVPSVVESHFPQDSKYGQKDGFKISVPKWVGNY